MESEKTDDHDHLIDSVRAAVDKHSDPHAEVPGGQPAETSHQPSEAADHAAQDMAHDITARMAQEDRLRSTEQSGKQRDARGRFTSATSTGEAGSVHTAGALHVPEAPAVKSAPSSWSAQAKAEWQNLSPALQEAVLKREEEMDRGSQLYRDRTQSYRQIESLLEPRRQVFQQYGLNDAQAIERLMVVSDGLSRNAAGTLAFLAEQFGVAPHQVFPKVQSGPSQQQIEQYVQQRIDTALAQTEVQRFEATAPEHYSVVKGLMLQLLQQGAAANMNDAYRQAIVQHPAVQSIEKQRSDRERRERQIRAANASLSGGPHGVAATPPRSNGRSSSGKFGDVADDVRAAMASLI